MVNIWGLTQPKPRQEESDWVRVEGHQFPEDSCRKFCVGVQPVGRQASGRPHYLSGTMQDCVGINLAHVRPFSLDISNVKHELAESVDAYCDPTSNLDLGLQKCVCGCQCGPIHLMTITHFRCCQDMFRTFRE